MTRNKPAVGERPLFWVGSSKRDLLAFPGPVTYEIGMALSVAQFGGKHPRAKPWKGEGPGVFEVVADHRGDTYRAAYTVRFQKAVYVLHAFQKKSPSGIETSRADVQLIAQRLRAAARDYEVRYGAEKK
ncbi:MAG TPA: type II toxin-antitoxin system RelE/ParE family toxin [Candidatus Limnocylindrales bacterium]|nr:type II toxin-antitoxin system RelE/ParE family toxin [Candidatus Limnocylindrales bacterium]